jgi:RNA polymerase sigma factor (sigma-70 family)
MLVMDPATTASLGRLVSKLTRDQSIREDLMQEAIVHFWKAECDRPGQTLSWYLQGCAFHLQHYLTCGRSVDSLKRRRWRVEVPTEEELNAWMTVPNAELNVVSQVQHRELLQQLSGRLTPRERAILRHLAEGLGPREIADRLKLSHPTAIRGRRRIADLVIRLGLVPKPTGDLRDQRSPTGGLGCEPTAGQARASGGRRGPKRVVARRPPIPGASPHSRSPSRRSPS